MVGKWGKEIEVGRWLVKGVLVTDVTTTGNRSLVPRYLQRGMLERVVLCGSRKEEIQDWPLGVY